MSKKALDFILDNTILPDNMDKELKKEVYKKIDEIEKDLEELERCKQDENILYKQDVVYLRQALQRYIDSPVLYETKTFGAKYIMSENHFKKLEKDLERLEKQDKILEIIKEKHLNFDRFGYAIKYWQTTKEQVDVYNSGIGNCFKYTEEEFDLIKEWLNEKNI